MKKIIYFTLFLISASIVNADMYDDFEDSYIDPAKWRDIVAGCGKQCSSSVSEGGGQLSISTHAMSGTGEYASGNIHARASIATAQNFYDLDAESISIDTSYSISNGNWASTASSSTAIYYFCDYDYSPCEILKREHCQVDNGGSCSRSDSGILRIDISGSTASVYWKSNLLKTFDLSSFSNQWYLKFFAHSWVGARGSAGASIQLQEIPYTPVNQPPSISSAYSDSTEENPKSPGEIITYTAEWLDPDDQTKIKICSTNSLTGIDCSATTICETTTWSSSSPSSCQRTAQQSDPSSSTSYAFVCDDENLCSSGYEFTWYVQRGYNQTYFIRCEDHYNNIMNESKEVEIVVQ